MIKILRLTRCFSTHSKVTILHSETNDIHFNLATEEFLYEDSTFYDLNSPTLFLWRNNKTIVIGRHQNPWKECHLQAMRRDNVALSRRITGGGAVYHDLGNTCFSFLTPYQIEDPLNYKSVNEKILLKALKELGVEAEASGRNDLTYHQKKISGSAYKLNIGNTKTGKGRKALHHGTILFNVDTKALQQYLNPNKAKLESKGISSVIARVMNLNEQFPNLNHNLFSQALEKAFVQYYSAKEVEKKMLTYKQLDKNQKIAKRFEELKSWEWLYGSSPEFKNNIETRFPWGIIDMYFDVEQGIIKKAKVYSDSINVDFVTSLNQLLNSGQIEYDLKGVQKLKNQLKAKLPQSESAKQIDELCTWMYEKF